MSIYGVKGSPSYTPFQPTIIATNENGTSGAKVLAFSCSAYCKIFPIDLD